jgi:hypothetical protein
MPIESLIYQTSIIINLMFKFCIWMSPDCRCPLGDKIGAQWVIVCVQCSPHYNHTMVHYHTDPDAWWVCPIRLKVLGQKNKIYPSCCSHWDKHNFLLGGYGFGSK